jgi:phage terminase large subunit-like protein
VLGGVGRAISFFGLGHFSVSQSFCGFENDASRPAYWLLDMVRARANPGDVDTLLLNTAMLDGKQVRIGFGQDPG